MLILDSLSHTLTDQRLQTILCEAGFVLPNVSLFCTLHIIYAPENAPADLDVNII